MVASNEKGGVQATPPKRSGYITKAYVIMKPVHVSSPDAANRIIIDVKLSAKAARKVVEQNPGSYIVPKLASK